LFDDCCLLKIIEVVFTYFLHFINLMTMTMILMTTILMTTMTILMTTTTMMTILII